MKFIEKYRTKISQVLGIAYILLFAFSEKKLEAMNPALIRIMMTAGIVLVGTAMIGRLWCALYIAGYKTDLLITYGPYSVCRNPLYLFSLLGGTGVGLCSESVTLALTIPAVFMIIYPITILREEKTLLAIHGDAYRRYMSFVPRFIPKWSSFSTPSEYLVNTKVFMREMRDAFCFALAVGLFEVIKAFIDLGAIKPLFTLY